MCLVIDKLKCIFSDTGNKREYQIQDVSRIILELNCNNLRVILIQFSVFFSEFIKRD